MFLKTASEYISKTSLRLRLTAIFVLIFGSVTIIFNLALYRFTIHILQNDFDDALYNYAIDISETIEIGEEGSLRVPPLTLERGKILPFSMGNALIRVRHISGEVLAQVGDFGKFDPPYQEAFKRITGGEDVVYNTIRDVSNIPDPEADSYRLLNFPLDNSKAPQILLQIAVPRTLYESQIHNRQLALGIGVPVVMLLATLGGWLLSASAMVPIKKMISAAHEIDATELTARIPVPIANDEIKDLAMTLNEMLERIQRAFESQERFVADASHQLLTPLTILKSEMELITRNNQVVEPANLESFQQEVDGLIRIVQDMLLLARVDAGLGALNLEVLHFDELVIDAISKCEKLARSKDVKLKFDILGDVNSQPTVKGDRDLLMNLVINLLENAIKYSNLKSSVQVSLRWSALDSVLAVQDEGMGIPEAQLPLIFERFSRGKAAEKQAKGYGLGLAIARKIAALHGANLSASNRDTSEKTTGAIFEFQIKNI